MAFMMHHGDIDAGDVAEGFQPLPAEAEGTGSGGAVPAPPFEGNPKHLKRNIKDATRAVVEGWVDGAQALEILKWLKAVGSSTDADPRARVNAAEAVIRILELGQKVAEHDDKERRLDDGDATENVGWQVNIRTKGGGD